MRSIYKLSPLKFAILAATVAIYIVLLLLSFNKHTETEPRGQYGVLRERQADPQEGNQQWLAEELETHLNHQPLITRTKNRLSKSTIPKDDVADDASDYGKETSVSGDSAGYDQSSNAVFSHPFVHPAPNIRRIYPRVKSKSRIDFKRLSKGQHDQDADRFRILPKEDDDIFHTPKTKKRTFDLVEGRSTCKPHSNIVYIKTHKTGSSTLQNIIYRYGDERNLTFALPARGVYIQSLREFEPSSVLPIQQGHQINIMANHVRFFYKDINGLMPPDTKYITIIRKSSDQFRSMYTYFTMDTIYKASLEQFSLNPEYFYQKYGAGKLKRHNGRDPLLFDLGMERSVSGNPSQVQDYIEFLDSTFHLVLIMEYFYESLILLKNLLCWDMRSLVHVHNKFRVSLDPESRLKSAEDERAAEDVVKRLDRWNSGDVKLYTYFNKTLWEKIDAYGRTKMATEVADLKRLCRDAKEQCMNGTRIREISRGTLTDIGLEEYLLKPTQIRNRTCKRLAMQAKDFLAHLRNKHIARFHHRDIT